MSLGKRLRLALVGLTLAAILAAGYGFYRNSQRMGAPAIPESATTQAEVGGPFSLTDHNGRRVTEKDFAGKYLLIFFGYSFCPDICPTTLTRVSGSLQILEDKAKDLQPLFITIDPDRDTVEVLRDYLSNFHPAILGLTGSAEEIDQVAKAYKVFYAKAETGASEDGDDPDYLMDHSGFVYFMDPKGNLAEVFFHDAAAESMAEAIAARL
jgi:protein SCO1/2